MPLLFGSRSVVITLTRSWYIHHKSKTPRWKRLQENLHSTKVFFLIITCGPANFSKRPHICQKYTWVKKKLVTDPYLWTFLLSSPSLLCVGKMSDLMAKLTLWDLLLLCVERKTERGYYITQEVKLVCTCLATDICLLHDCVRYMEVKKVQFFWGKLPGKEIIL